MGTGYTSASTIGRKPATLAEMRQCITDLRKLLAGEAVDFQGTPGRLAFAKGRPVSLLMAASGPKAIELAGEIADGVMLLVGFHRGIVDAVLTHLDKGARRSGRRLGGPRHRLGGAHGNRGHDGRGAAPGPPHGRASGHHARALPVARAHGIVDPALRHSTERLQHLPRPLARAELGAGDRRHVVRPGRGHCRAVRRPGPGRHARALRPAHHRD